MSKNFTKNKENNIINRLLVTYSERDLINYIVSDYIKKHKINTKNKLDKIRYKIYPIWITLRPILYQYKKCLNTL